jgi:ADP-ribose pyrophosphatase YjhB (NUDIX family)
MMHSLVTDTPAVGWTMIHEEEVSELAAQYGTPVRRFSHIQADEYIRAYRWRADSDRRAEVVFAIQDPAGKIWVHAKSHYPGHIFRLPSGGVKWAERVQDALLREVEEETGLSVYIRRFLGVIEYCFHDGNSTANFASYVFLLKCESAPPRLPSDGEISAFRAILPFQLLQLSAEMRNMVGDRRGWGQWRAEVHDLVYEILNEAGPLGYD